VNTEAQCELGDYLVGGRDNSKRIDQATPPNHSPSPKAYTSPLASTR
jgi:hypothetical protein